jgi:2-methylisocitrate lyase-like PEP mutase family enzyme
MNQIPRLQRERKSTVLRRLMKREDPVASIWGGTAHHAQLAEYTGFELFGISGSHVSTQLFGYPDIGLVTMSELVENVRRVCRATSLPVIVDIDTGFGNAINTQRTVEEIILAGAAGVFMEDQVSPKRCGYVKGKEVLSIEEAAGKVRAACDKRDEMDPDFVIIARSDARGAPGGNLEDTVERGKAFLAAGADVFYPEALRSREEITYIREAIPDCLLMTIPHTIQPPVTQAEIKSLGLWCSMLFVERIAAVYLSNFLKAFKEQGEERRIAFAQEYKDHPLNGFGIFDLTKLPEYLEQEQRYLPAERLARYEESLGEYEPKKAETP